MQSIDIASTPKVEGGALDDSTPEVESGLRDAEFPIVDK